MRVPKKLRYLLAAGQEEARKGRIFRLDGGWAVGGDGKTIYLRLPDRGDPNKARLQLARYNEGLAFRDSSYVVLEGLDIGFFCSGFKLVQEGVIGAVTVSEGVGLPEVQTHDLFKVGPEH